MNQTEIKAAIAKIPLDAIDVSQPELYQNDTIGLYFERLRQEAPVHYCAASRYGPYWSVTRYNDIMTVDKDHATFSSQRGGIQIVDFEAGMERVNFINMDPPAHGDKRKTVSPIVAPANLANLQHTIRERVINILDNLPRNETFDWVDLVSIE
ncbi:MAG: cytochrome P450, partial [Pseudomonadota bacterium]